MKCACSGKEGGSRRRGEEREGPGKQPVGGGGGISLFQAFTENTLNDRRGNVPALIPGIRAGIRLVSSRPKKKGKTKKLLK